MIILGDIDGEFTKNFSTTFLDGDDVFVSGEEFDGRSSVSASDAKVEEFATVSDGCFTSCIDDVGTDPVVRINRQRRLFGAAWSGVCFW